MNNFDTKPLLNEINDVLKNGFHEILKDYMKRHWLLEETHDKLVNLPSVKQYYNTSSQNNTNFDTSINIEHLAENHDTVKENISEKISNLDDKINNMWKIYGEHLVKMSNQLEELKNEITSLKNTNKPNSSDFSSNSEKENIKLEILDDVVTSESKNEYYEEVQIEEELEEDEEDEELEEDEEIEVEELEEVEEVEEVKEAEEVASVETETEKQEDTEEEEEFIEIEIDDVTYCTNNEENGIIYELDEDGNVGKPVGYLKEGDAYFE
jgi:hypothetical protein